jgi:O-acetyl-ADP-ribose deacetylase (regulator of RNase III)
MISYVRGNLFDLNLPAIGHGVNCRGMMGAGIAKQFRDRYPDMYKAYKSACAANGPEILAGRCMPWQPGPGEPLILNLFTQIDPGPNADVRLIRKAVLQSFNYCSMFNIYTLGIPLIGCGIGGLDWDREVLPAIADVAGDHEFAHLVDLRVVLLPDPVV